MIVKINKHVSKITFLTLVFYSCFRLIDYALFVYDGINVDLPEFTFAPFLLWTTFILSKLFFSDYTEESRLHVFSLVFYTVINIFVIFNMINVVPATITHSYTSFYIKDIRYDIREISLEDLENLDSGNHIIYVGRPSCEYCNYSYDKLYKCSLQQPLIINYYNTDVDRDSNKYKMLEVLNNYDVTEVPMVLFVVNGKLDRKMCYNEIVNYFEDIVNYYKTKGVFFVL